MLNVVHVTHEAVQKIGGIGAVLEGLMTADSYRSAVSRSIVVGPLFSRWGDLSARLGPNSQVLYSSLDGKTDHPAAAAFRVVQERFGVDIVYGTRTYQAPDHGAKQDAEVLLIDVGSVRPDSIAVLKFRMFESFGVMSDRYDSIWEFEQYVRLAGPAIAALKALGIGAKGHECAIISHEFMGMPTALAAKLEPDFHCRTLFHAHETATIRRIVEEHPGHDTMFYNVMRKAAREGRYCDDVFGEQDNYFKHSLIQAARHTDGILAVGPQVIEEFRFLGPEFETTDISLAYNGIPAARLTYDEAAMSKRRLKQYCGTILGFEPDYIFTHVTRLVRSKGLWRDLWVLEHVEEALRRENRTAVFFALSTEIGGPRKREDILRMERAYRWPVAHREGLPDLSAGEAAFHVLVQEFNARARHCKVVFLNQFGFDRQTCGDRMSTEMDFWDIRRGSDVEFGQSIYEPFGIAQLEALSFGAICVVSSVCGCVGLALEAAGSATHPNVVVADYTAWPDPKASIDSLLAMTSEQRDQFDRTIAKAAAAELMRRLPRTEAEKAAYVERGYQLAERMSWNVVTATHILPAIERALRRPRVVHVG